MKCIKVEEKQIEYISFVAPRKSPAFQEDLYPDCSSNEAALVSSSCAILDYPIMARRLNCQPENIIDETRPYANPKTGHSSAIPIERKAEAKIGTNSRRRKCISIYNSLLAITQIIHCIIGG
jgi:hypothetical protein